MEKLELSEKEKSELKISYLSDDCLTFHNTSDKTFDIHKWDENTIDFELNDSSTGENVRMFLTHGQIDAMIKFINLTKH